MVQLHRAYNGLKSSALGYDGMRMTSSVWETRAPVEESVVLEASFAGIGASSKVTNGAHYPNSSLLDPCDFGRLPSRKAVGKSGSNANVLWAMPCAAMVPCAPLLPGGTRGQLKKLLDHTQK